MPSTFTVQVGALCEQAFLNRGPELRSLMVSRGAGEDLLCFLQGGPTSGPHAPPTRRPPYDSRWRSRSGRAGKPVGWRGSRFSPRAAEPSDGHRGILLPFAWTVTPGGWAPNALISKPLRRRISIAPLMVQSGLRAEASNLQCGEGG